MKVKNEVFIKIYVAFFVLQSSKGLRAMQEKNNQNNTVMARIFIP